MIPMVIPNRDRRVLVRFWRKAEAAKPKLSPINFKNSIHSLDADSVIELHPLTHFFSHHKFTIINPWITNKSDILHPFQF